jgi:hypothetical protein
MSIEFEKIFEKTGTLVESTKIISIFVQFAPVFHREIEIVCLDKQKNSATLTDRRLFAARQLAKIVTAVIKINQKWKGWTDHEKAYPLPGGLQHPRLLRRPRRLR